MGDIKTDNGHSAGLVPARTAKRFQNVTCGFFFVTSKNRGTDVELTALDNRDIPFDSKAIPPMSMKVV